MMKKTEWLDHIRPHKTPKGSRLDLRLYVYPDGHGNIIVQQDDGDPGQPVNDFEEARGIFEALWEKASSAGQSTEAEEDELSKKLEQISSNNLHGEIPTEGPVGNEAW